MSSSSTPLLPRSAEEQARFETALIDLFEHRISSVLDAMGGLAIMVGIAERHPLDNAPQVMSRFAKMGTIDLRIDFLRQGIGQHFVASADVTRLGGRVASTQMRFVNDEGTLIATGAASFIVS